MVSDKNVPYELPIWPFQWDEEGNQKNVLRMLMTKSFFAISAAHVVGAWWGQQ